VVSNSLTKPDPDLRKFIRSHVMLGKNQGRTLPPRKKKPRSKDVATRVSEDAMTPLSNDSGSSSLVMVPRISAKAPATSSPNIPAISIPANFGSRLSGLRLAADDVEPKNLEVVLRSKL
jgi:hypothetical protein